MGESKPLACVEELRVGEVSPHSDTVAIIVAGGVGERFGDPRGKQFVDLCGLPLMSWAILAFDRAPSVASIVLVCAPDRRAEVGSDVLSKLTLRCPVTIAPAGDTRQASVMSGLEAMPRGGRLELQARVPGPDAVRVRVHDTGQGMSTEQLARALAGGASSKASGHGIGLGVARALLALHAGRLEVRSTPGHGTTVEVELPLAPRAWTGAAH